MENKGVSVTLEKALILTAVWMLMSVGALLFIATARRGPRRRK
jgi:hypothetical protein